MNRKQYSHLSKFKFLRLHSPSVNLVHLKQCNFLILYYVLYIRNILVPHTPPSVIKPRPTSAPEDKALLRVPRPEIIEQILKPKPSVSPVMKDHNDFETLKPQSPAPPVDQHIKISIRAPKPQFEMQLKDLYHYKVGEQVK